VAKYVPTDDDLLKDKFCAYCGDPFTPISEEDECCSHLCEALFTSWRENYEKFLEEEYYYEDSLH
jgi:hypothetical protein